MTSYDAMRLALHNYLTTLHGREHHYGLAHASYAQGKTTFEAPRGDIPEAKAREIRLHIDAIVGSKNGEAA